MVLLFLSDRYEKICADPANKGSNKTEELKMTKQVLSSLTKLSCFHEMELCCLQNLYTNNCNALLMERVYILYEESDQLQPVEN